MPGALLRRLFRLPLVIGLLAGGLATVLLAFPMSGERFRRTAIRIWSRWLCRCCGLTLVELPAPGARALSELPPGRLIVANHISWLDIFAINAACPAAFVAKAEIRSWPLVGTLVARTGTLFIERGKRRAVHRMIEHIGRSLEAGGRVAVFPEGTTGTGRALMPFHANLVQASVVSGAPLMPVGLRYRDRAEEMPQAVEFVGDTTFVASLWRVIGASGLRCELHPLPEIVGEPGMGRHELAQRARESISARLALPLEDSVPARIRDLRAAPR